MLIFIILYLYLHYLLQFYHARSLQINFNLDKINKRQQTEYIHEHLNRLREVNDGFISKYSHYVSTDGFRVKILIRY